MYPIYTLSHLANVSVSSHVYITEQAKASHDGETDMVCITYREVHASNFLHGNHIHVESYDIYEAVLTLVFKRYL